MSVAVVVGAQWGDEGKGKVVDLYAERARVVARWAGGANAGHTIVVQGKKYVTRVIPSGVLHPHVTCVLGEGMAIDPRILLDEIRTFRGHGLLSRADGLVIAGRAHLTLPWHRALDGLRESRPGAIGTTKKGIGPTYQSKAARTGVRVEDLLRPERLRLRMAQDLELTAPLLAHYGVEVPALAAAAEEYLGFAAEIGGFVRDASRFLHDRIKAGDNVVFEGGQGVLLDLDHGTYPFVTSSSTTAGGACSGCGIGPTLIDTVVGMVKAYTTRVGNGPFPTELTDDVGARLRDVGAEFGTVTGRTRRCGWLDIPALRVAMRISGIERLAITKLDVLTGLPRLKLCVGYRLGGAELDEMPLDLDDLALAEPIYEEHEGWSEPLVVGPAGLAGLPRAARSYLARVSELLGRPICLVSVGPGREQTLVEEPPFGGAGS